MKLVSGDVQRVAAPHLFMFSLSSLYPQWNIFQLTAWAAETHRKPDSSRKLPDPPRLFFSGQPGWLLMLAMPDACEVCWR